MDINKRKSEHITRCTDSGLYDVEPCRNTLFSSIHFLHNPMPELAEEEINTHISFLGYDINLPLFISCMTGGADGGLRLNRDLAKAAQVCHIPVGMGSIRILFDQPELFSHFYLKPYGPDIPVLANLGMIQVRDIQAERIIELIKKLEVQGLVIHLNPGQELFQRNGDTDFRGLKDALSRFCEKAAFPVIIKETGFGIPPVLIDFFISLGIAYVDLAGKGGTNWVTVESYGLPDHLYNAAGEFDTWGFPTCLLLDLCDKKYPGILASGGLRTGHDLAVSLALGACAGGMALPFIRAVHAGGVEKVCSFVEEIEKTLRSVMVLSGVRDIPGLKNVPLWREPSYIQLLDSLKKAVYR
ncbi:MAG: type 2 isopentenyl-diphosphate Delta-isomerase [Spirochaetales bacterium]|nr:type 2 isopentenyl-diphosphate Delta-isomerase [Spirochaetales bacterium]